MVMSAKHAACGIDGCDREPFGSLERPRCILHVDQPEKDKEAFTEELRNHVRESYWSFDKIQFPRQYEFPFSEVELPVDFSNCGFPGSIDFSGVSFLKEVEFASLSAVDFTDCEFHESAEFTNVIHGTADFSGAIFHQEAKFTSFATFEMKVYFEGARFQTANFKQVRFENQVDLDEINVEGDLKLQFAEADGEISLRNARIDGDANFTKLQADWGLDISRTQFGGQVRFGAASCKRGVNISFCRFEDEVLIEDAEFEGERIEEDAEVTMEENEFQDRVIIQNTELRPSVSLENSDFSGAVFLQGVEIPEWISFKGVTFRDRALLTGTSEGKSLFQDTDVDFREVQIDPEVKLFFRRVDLRRVRFLDTDLRRFDFTDVQWPKGEADQWWYVLGAKPTNMVYDHVAARNSDGTDGSWKKIERLYRELKQNLEERRNYPAAGDFHVGEKKMMRRTTGSEGRRFMLWVYEKVSLYGERATPAFIILGVTIFAFAALYAIGGIEPINGASIKSPIHEFGHGLNYSLQVAAFSRPEGLSLESNWAYMFTVFQRALTTPLIALAILAIRQQMKR